MVLYGYDASVYNSVQGSKNWVLYFNDPDDNMIGAVNTAYTVGAIFGGFFLGGPVADFLGRKYGMAIGCVMVIASTFMQTFAPRGNIACFLAGRCIIGIGQGIALSKSPCSTYGLTKLRRLTSRPYSCGSNLHWRAGTGRNSWKDHDLLANVLLGWFLYLFLGKLRVYRTQRELG